MKWKLTWDYNSNQYRFLKRAVKQALQDTIKGAVKAALKRLLLPAALGGLPVFTGRARASFDAIAKEYGIRTGSRPYQPNPNYPSALSRTAQNEGKSNPVTDNNGLSGTPQAKVNYSMDIDIRNHGFPYFEHYEFGTFNRQFDSQLPQPWNLLLAMNTAARDHIKANSDKNLKKNISPIIRTERRR